LLSDAIPEETLDEVVGQPRREKRKESFMPVEITGGWVRAGKGIGGRIVWGGLRRGPSAPVRHAGRGMGVPVKGTRDTKTVLRSEQAEAPAS
jgi:hypothetical protein